MDTSQPIHAEAVWTEKTRRHREQILPWTASFRDRRRRRESHPVYDFLFSYYSYRPSQLEIWHPGIGAALHFSRPESVATFRRNRRYEIENGTVRLAHSSLTPRVRNLAHWTRNLLISTAGRPPRFGCSGLHEWAMVYRLSPGEIRHQRHPLRLSPGEISDVVESNRLTCTHFDAFRFFTPAARPLNSHQPERSQIPELEQGGCLHTNMDLYKWSYKLSPWISSDLVADAFHLAREARELDMRASPYDLAATGFAPIPVETPEGRQSYEHLQRSLANRAVPLRQRLIDAIDLVLGHAGKAGPPQARSTY